MLWTVKEELSERLTQHHTNKSKWKLGYLALSILTTHTLITLQTMFKTLDKAGNVRVT
jgi:hypothetical protein